MKILLVMDPGILVPPKGYGGHERLVYMFAKEYARIGHEVHLLVTKGSCVEGCIVHPFGVEGYPPTKINAFLAIPKAWWFLWRYRNKFDLIHNFGRLAFLLPVLNHPVRKIMTYGRIIDKKNILLINKLPNKNIKFTAPSDWCVATGSVSGEWHTVYNAIDFSKYTLVEKVSFEAPLIFLSRLERLKGAHEAIKIALETGNRLILAGNISNLPDEKKYYEEEIKPFIDGEIIQYVGTLDDEGKNKYLGMAKAMLFPARTQEAFGMVMIESMACGTPVIAYASGAIPEIIEDNKNGYLCNNMSEIIEKLKNINLINRFNCKESALRKYDIKTVAPTYLNLFQ